MYNQRIEFKVPIDNQNKKSPKSKKLSPKKRNVENEECESSNEREEEDEKVNEESDVSSEYDSDEDNKHQGIVDDDNIDYYEYKYKIA